MFDSFIAEPAHPEATRWLKYCNLGIHFTARIDDYGKGAALTLAREWQQKMQAPLDALDAFEANLNRAIAQAQASLSS